MTTATTHGATYRIHLGALPDAPRRARRFITSLMAQWGLASERETVETLELLISEVTTNAVRATGRDSGPVDALSGETIPTIEVRARATDRTPTTTEVVVEVWDNSPDTSPVPPADAADDAEGGRGLFLIGALAHAWGCTEETLPPMDTPGKTVWFALLVERAIILPALPPKDATPPAICLPRRPTNHATT